MLAPALKSQSNEAIFDHYWDHAFPEHGSAKAFSEYVSYRELLAALDLLSIGQASADALMKCLADKGVAKHVGRLNELRHFVGEPKCGPIFGEASVARMSFKMPSISLNVALFNQASMLVKWLKSSNCDASFWRIYSGLEQTYVQTKLSDAEGKPSARRWDIR